MKSIKQLLFTTLVLAISLASCADLSVDNLNQPDTARALSSVDDLETLASNLYASWYTLTYGYSSSEGSPVHAMAVVADNSSCSWGNVGMRDTSSEPRVQFDNTVSYSYEYITNQFFNSMYSVLSSASDVLRAMDNGTDFGANASQVEAWSKFIQGISLANIALSFDQGYIITEDTPEEEIVSPILVSNADIAAKALSLLDEAIAVADANTFSLPSSYINGVSGDNVLLSQLANSYAARLLAYMPRTASENSSVNWSTVKAYAEDGITSDFMVLMDDIVWVNDYKWTVAYPGWGRSDMRLASMMYPESIAGGYPDYNPDGLDFGAPDSATVVDDENVDDRIRTDFEHLSSNNFRPERGLYHFSSFRVSRYDDYISLWTTELPEFYLAELHMILAEAELELGNLSAAAAILNDPANTRKARGGLPDVAVDATAISDAIHHERQIELTITSFGAGYFDMRKRDLLQAGSWTQLPLPAKIQELLQFETPYYTFGGTQSSSSTGGWR